MSLLFSVEEKQRAEAYLGFTRAEHFTSQPKVIRGALCSAISLQHLMNMEHVHCDMRLSLFKSWQHSVTTLVGWLK